MRIFDARNVYKRADRLLEYHIGLLGAEGRNFEKDSEAYYSYDESGEEYLRAGYSTTKKMLSRTFNFELKQVIGNIDFDDDFQLKLRFSGFKEISGANFIPVKGFKGCEDCFNDPELLTLLAKKAKEVELAYIIIEYHKRSGQIEIRICPYAGAFLWVVIPPVFYDMKLRQNEIQTLMEITDLLKSYAKKRTCLAF